MERSQEPLHPQRDGNSKSPIGLQPIELLWLSQERHLVSLAVAQHQAAELGARGTVSPSYLRHCSRSALGAAMHGGQRRQGIARQRITRSAAEALAESPEKTGLLQEIVLDWMEIVHLALTEIADGRLYREAMSDGEALLAAARGGPSQRLVAQTLFRLALLNLDPFIVGRPSSNYEASIRHWEAGFAEEFAEELRGLPEADWKMPSPAEALGRAVKYLREMIDHAEGDAMVRGLKALIQALGWHSLVSQADLNQVEIGDLCRRALARLDPSRHPVQWLEVLGALPNHGEVNLLEEADRVLRRSPDQLVHDVGPVVAIDAIRSGIRLLMGGHAARALDLLRSAKPLVERHGSDADRSAWLEDELTIATLAIGPDMVTPIAPYGVQVAEEELRRRADEGSWDRRTLCAGLLRLARISGQTDEERAGLALLEEAVRLAPAFVESLLQPINLLRAILHRNAAVNEWKAGNWADATAEYGTALRGYVDLRLVEKSHDCLVWIEDLARIAAPEVAVQVVRQVAPLALKLEALIGERAILSLQRLCERTIAGSMKGTADLETVNFLFQVAKGRRFAHVLSRGTRYRVNEDAEAQAMLKAIQNAPQGVSVAPVDEERLLTVHADPRPLHGGGTDEQRLSNLQHAFDSRVSALSFRGDIGEETAYLSCAEIQRCLDDRTVLVSLYSGSSDPGETTVYATAFTRERVRLYRTVQAPAAEESRPGGADPGAGRGAVARLVHRARAALSLQVPRGEIASAAARLVLADCFRALFGKLGKDLQGLSNVGKDHLCIVPHGPLHYIPFHLLGIKEPLASKWKVSYLPNLHLLAGLRNRSALGAKRHDWITSIGLGFPGTNPHDLPCIPGSAREASEVAAIFGKGPLLEKHATRKATFAALSDSRFVHVSTHGRHNYEAPALHLVYMAADSDSDGRLFAFEVPTLDLRRLEVLTLSACETALGRFDLGDNLRGLPASFLIAGVQTLVGTLWRPDVEVSRYFFVAFYSRLRRGASRLEAFSAAQRRTRKRFPPMRAWGPFYMIGDCDTVAGFENKNGG
ncbi:MAG: CHAT domain-containing protein [Planctomycetota bacterium]